MVGRIEEDVNSILHICQDEYKQGTQRCQSCLHHHCRHLGQDVLGHKLSLANNPQVRQTVYHFSVQAILKIKLQPVRRSHYSRTSGLFSVQSPHRFNVPSVVFKCFELVIKQLCISHIQ